MFESELCSFSAIPLLFDVGRVGCRDGLSLRNLDCLKEKTTFIRSHPTLKPIFKNIIIVYLFHSKPQLSTTTSISTSWNGGFNNNIKVHSILFYNSILKSYNTLLSDFMQRFN